MNKPIQLVAIFDDRDNTEHVTAIVYGLKQDLKILRGMLDNAGDDEVSFNGWSRYAVHCDLVQPVKYAGFWLLDFDVDEEFLEATAVEVVYAFINQFL